MSSELEVARAAMKRACELDEGLMLLALDDSALDGIG